MVRLHSRVFSTLFTLALQSNRVTADGTGLIGYGKNLYNPTCAFACRNVIRQQVLACTPKVSTENHGTAHNPVRTPPECFVQDITVLKTIALCIDTYCSLTDKPSSELLDNYWASHLGTGTLGDDQYFPTMSYHDALGAARKDENDARSAEILIAPSSAKIPTGLKPYNVTSPLALTIGGSRALNRTSLVAPILWQLQYNYLSDFEINEKGHSTMTFVNPTYLCIVIAVVAITLPVLLSLDRFVPGLASIKAKTTYPALFGKRHREPTVGGLAPTRGQTLYILLISILNLVLLVAPYTIKQPQASFTSKGRQLISIIGNRAGTMAMGNVIALFLFSSRNSVLFYVTDWNYSTYLLLHRWLGYWTVVHTIIHSAMLWKYYAEGGSYAAELLRLYWRWGIVGTVAVCAIVPFSLLTIRQRFYEFFLVSHIVLAFVFLIGYYYHIWYVYTYNWGYEIWMFITAGIWAVDRLARIGRLILGGSRTATVTIIHDTDEEYLRIEIDGRLHHEGVAYLCFPTLSWKFRESYPFSISGAHAALHDSASTRFLSGSESSLSQESEKKTATDAVEKIANQNSVRLNTTFFTRACNGITKNLLRNVQAAERNVARIRVLVEGPYQHSGHVQSHLAKCDRILCIAGGVGITACLPFLQAIRGQDTQLYWSSRKAGLIASLKPSLDTLPSSVKTKTLAGERFDVRSLVEQALSRSNDERNQDLSAIIVSGPPGLADEVCFVATHTNTNQRYTLIDEAHSW